MSDFALQIVGDDIEFFGFKVAKLTFDAPPTIQEEFQRQLLAGVRTRVPFPLTHSDNGKE